MVLGKVGANLSCIEALRGLAATAVVLYHCARHVDRAFGAPGLIAAFQAGHSGVDLFFVISGFIILYIHRPDLGRPERLPHYLSRRFSRVFPIYWIALGVSMLMTVLGDHGMPPAGTMLAETFLLPGSDDPILGVAWTLHFEIVFYAVFTVLIVNRRAGLMLMAAWLAAIVAAAAGLVGPGMPPPLCSTYSLEFFMGMAAAYLLQRGKVAAPRSLAMAGMVLFAAALLAESTGALDGFGDAARLAYGLPAAMLVLGLVASETAGQLSAARWLRVLGNASYSIYLFQFVFIGTVWQFMLVSHLDQRLSNLVVFVLLSTAALVGGVVVSQAIERPLLRALRNRRRPPVAQQV